MKTAGESHHRGALGKGPRHLDGVLHRFGAGIHEQGFLVEITRSRRVEPLRQGYVGLIGRYVEAGVGEAFHLRLHRRHHFGVAVAGVEHADAAGEVDIALAFHVPQLGVLGSIGKYSVDVGGALSHRGLTPLHQLGIGRHKKSPELSDS